MALSALDVLQNAVQRQHEVGVAEAFVRPSDNVKYEMVDKFESGMHAVLPAHAERGLAPGVIFALRNRNDGVNVGQQNRLHPYYLVYVDMDGNAVIPHTEVKHLLDLVRSVAKPCEEPIPAANQKSFVNSLKKYIFSSNNHCPIRSGIRSGRDPVELLEGYCRTAGR